MPTTTATPTAIPTPTTFQIQVSTSSDDAKEKGNGSVRLSSSDLEFATDQLVGIRFTGITVPQGATIASASIQLRALEADTLVTDLIIEGQAADTTSTFTTASNDISSRPRTTAFASWSPPAWNTVGEAGPDQQTSDFSPVIQEIVDRTGWSSGNSLVIVITGSGNRVADSFDGDSGAAGAPLLQVAYTPMPEPGLLLQLASGVLALAVLGKRRRCAKGRRSERCPIG
jgi:hypothetical protein